MSITKETLEKIVSNNNPADLVFIETGTWIGDTIQKALDIGFKEIKSIELSVDLFNKARQRFKNNINVSLYNGDSAEQMQNIIYDISDKIVFWLDAHYSGGETALGKQICPLYAELDVISKHKRNDHIILIDDIRDVHNGYMRVTLNELIQKLKLINPDYKIYYVDGHTKNDILVAFI
jgi:hypothetical protein